MLKHKQLSYVLMAFSMNYNYECDCQPYFEFEFYDTLFKIGLQKKIANIKQQTKMGKTNLT